MNNHGSVTQGETGAEHITTRKGMWGVKNGADTTGFGGQENVVTIAAPAHRPYGGWFDEVVDIIGELAMADGLQPEDVIEKVTTQYGELVIFIKRGTPGACSPLPA